MPRNRNRGIINNFEFPPEFLRSLPSPDKVNVLKKSPQLPTYLCFGEPVSVEYKKYGYGKIGDVSSSSDYDNISDFDIVSFGRSSASSISWSEEFDVEATQLVKIEFERLDKIFQGKESIPAHYNRDEYEQWMKVFPQIRVLENEDIPQHNQQYLQNCDRDSTSSPLPQSKKANSIKFAVIEDTLQSVSSKEPKCKPNKGLKHYHKQINQSRTEKFTRRFDNILRISPVLLQEPVNRSFYLDTRQQSSHSVYQSAKSASKWMREERQDSTSLPYLTMESAKIKPTKTLNNKAGNSNKLMFSSKTSLSKTYISLPPIKTLTIPPATQYRSVSATPRKVYNEQSVVSAHIDSLKRRRKVAQNKLDSIHNLLNYPK